MSAAQFNLADSTIRAFWRNFRDVQTGLIGMEYQMVLVDLQTLNPAQMAQRNRFYQLNYGIPENIDLPVLIDNSGLTEPPISPVYDSMFGFGYAGQWYWIPLLFSGSYRAKYRVKKSYWTGCARRRRNL